MGAVAGAATAGIGSHFGAVGSGFGGTSGLSGVGLELTRATVHGMSNMIVNGAFGNNLSAGTFAIGAGGSLMGSGLHGAPGAVQIAGSAAFSGGIAEATGGDFWRGAATGATVSGLNHLAHAGVKGLKNRALINRIKKEGWAPIDMSDPKKAYKNSVRGLRLMRLKTTTNRLDGILDGPLHMKDVYDFSTMTASSGWDVKSGGGLEYYYFRKHAGIDIVMQNDRARILDVDITNRLHIRVHTGGSGGYTSEITYSESNYDLWLGARNYIWYGNK